MTFILHVMSVQSSYPNLVRPSATENHRRPERTRRALAVQTFWGPPMMNQSLGYLAPLVFAKFG